MKAIASALIFATCLGWIAASLLLHSPGATQMGHWDWLAVIGAVVALFGALDE